MGRPRVLCLIHLPPPVHGVTLVNRQIAESRAIAAHFDLDIVPLQFAETVDDLGRVSTRKLWRAVAVGVELTRALARKPAALYLTLSPHGGALYRDCVYAGLARLAGVPRVFHLHAHGAAHSLGRAARWLFDGAWVIHVAPQLVDETEGLVDPGRVLIVENGVPDRNPAGTLASSGHAVSRVLFLSNMLETKGPGILVEALAILKRRGIALEATFAGPGASPAFHAAVAHHGLSVCHVGAVDDAAKDDLYRTHDVFALPTLRDALPLVVIEAMQHGLPVVSTTVGALAELVADGTTGHLVPPGDANALADRLAELATRPELRRELGRAGRARYLERFTLDKFEQRLVAALARVLDDRSVRTPRLARDKPVRET